MAGTLLAAEVGRINSLSTSLADAKGGTRMDIARQIRDIALATPKGSDARNQAAYFLTARYNEERDEDKKRSLESMLGGLGWKKTVVQHTSKIGGRVPVRIYEEEFVGPKFPSAVPKRKQQPKHEEPTTWDTVKEIAKTVGKGLVTVALSPFMISGCGPSGEITQGEKDAGGTDSGIPPIAIVDSGLLPVDAGTQDAGLVEQEQFVMPKLPSHGLTIAFALATISEGTPLSVDDGSGNIINVTGQLLFVEAKRDPYTSPKISVKDQDRTLFFYNSETKQVYYYDGDAADYGFVDVNRPFKIASPDDVTYTEGSGSGSGVSIDLDAQYGLAVEVAGVISQIRENYGQWLTDGLSDIGADANLGDYFDKSAVDGLLEGVTVVIHRNGSYSLADFPYLLVSDIYLDPAKKEFFKGTILHEFFHNMFAAVSKANGTEGKEFYVQTNPTFMEGSAQLLTKLAILSAPSDFVMSAASYGPSVEMTVFLLDALGPDKFLKTFFAPDQIDYNLELSGLMGKSYEDFSQYYSRSTVMLPGTYDPVAMLTTVRFVGELQAAGVVDFDAMLEQHEATMTTLYGDILRPFLTRYGLGDGPLLEQSYNGAKYMNWNPHNSVPYDVRTAASEAMAGDLSTIAERYKTHFLILNSLDYENHDAKAQLVAAGVLRNMLEDFASYWNGLSTDERLSNLVLREGNFVYAAAYALGARYGINLASLVSAFDEPLSNGADLEFQPMYLTHLPPVSSMDSGLPATLDINSKIGSGTVTLALPASWADTLIFYTEGGVKNTVETNAGGTITLTFSGGKATISGLSTETTTE